VQHVKFRHSLVVAALLCSSPAFAQGGAGAPKNPIGWPPKLEVGQQWYAGIGKLGFNINLNAKDADGDPMGVATGNDNRTYQTFFFFNKNTGFADLYMRNTAASYRCIFSASSVNNTNPNDVSLIGAAFVYDAKIADPAKRFVQQQEPCLVTWTNAPNAPVSIQTGSPTNPPPVSSNPTPPPAPPVATTPPPAPPPTATAAVKLPTTSLSIAWPPKISSGQKWYLALGSAGYDLELTKSAPNGISSGTATSGATKLEAFFYFNGNENRAVLEMASATTTYYCYFGIRGAEEKVLNGEAATRTGNGNIQPSANKCALYLLTAPTTTALLQPPLL
jgi:hypothetical protein